MKKIISLVLIVCVMLSLATIAGCGKSDESKGSDATTITIASDYRIEPDETSSTYAEDKKHLENVEKKYNVKFVFNYIPQWEEYSNQYITATASGIAFGDICFIDYTLAYPKYVVKNYVAEIPQGLLNATDSWNVEGSAGLKYNGKQYGLLLNETQPPVEVMLFNKKIFADAGLPNLYELQSSGNWTWDTFLEVARSATSNGKYGVAAYGKLGFMDTAFIHSNGVNYITKGENPQYNLESAEVQAAMQFAYDLYYKYNVAEVVTEDKNDWEYTKNQFISGNAAMLVCETWQLEAMKESMASDKFGVVAIPKGPNCETYQTIYSKGNVAFVAPNADLSDLKIEAINAFFAPYSGKASYEEIVEKYCMDEESIDTFNLLIKNAEYNFNTGMMYETITNNYDFGLASKTPPATFAAQIKNEALKEMENSISDQ